MASGYNEPKTTSNPGDRLGGIFFVTLYLFLLPGLP